MVSLHHPARRFRIEAMLIRLPVIDGAACRQSRTPCLHWQSILVFFQWKILYFIALHCMIQRIVHCGSYCPVSTVEALRGSMKRPSYPIADLCRPSFFAQEAFKAFRCSICGGSFSTSSSSPVQPAIVGAVHGATSTASMRQLRSTSGRPSTSSVAASSGEMGGTALASSASQKAARVAKVSAALDIDKIFEQGAFAKGPSGRATGGRTLFEFGFTAK
jgi:hypothetical protein